jgi:predicted HTH domain antitoxin
MSVVIPDELLQTARMSESELKEEIAIVLFQKEKLTLGQASRFCDLPLAQFQHRLAGRRIPVHYDGADFEQDLQTLRELGRL